MRRMRATAPLRGLARETELAASHLVYPMFVVAGGEKRTPIASLPGIDHLSIDGAVEEAGIAHVARDPRGAAVRPAGGQGRARHGRLRRRGRDPARHARDQGRPPGPAGDRRPVPVRVHEPRPLRRAARRRRRRQRPDARAARPHRGLAGRGRRRRRRAERHDGRPRRRAARARSTSTACPRRRSSPTARSSPPPSTARSARPPTPRPRWATAAATRWIPPTRARPSRRRALDEEEGADVLMVKPALPVPRRDPPDPRDAPSCRSPPTTSAASTR